jgi:predicted nuclease of restriction endonuclease-like (RecB) superfamily
MKNMLLNNKEYKDWLVDIKTKVRKAQLKAAVKVNTELLLLYWELGADIVLKQKHAKWGDGFLVQLSKDLAVEFPDMQGFSKRNLELMRQWFLFYNPIAKQAVSQFKQKDGLGQQAVGQIPWGHNIAIISKCKNIKEALYYVRNTIKYNWSRSVLIHQIESRLYKREGKAAHNFAVTLPKPQSDLAAQTLKDPYVFDFLIMRKGYDERELETALVTHVTQFLLELGAGFAYVGRQVPLSVGGQEFFIDLLFYNTKLRCYVVIELKTVDFEPEHAGKLNFYLTAVDRQLRTEHDSQTVGILICKKKNKVVAEYALSDIRKPIGVSEYRLTQSLPKKFKSSLPTIKEIETELSKDK